MQKELTPSCLYYIVTSRVHRSAEPLYLVTSAVLFIEPARSARARRACALRALGLLLADGAPTLHSGEGEDFLTGQQNFFTETAVTLERKVEKLFPLWEINRHAEG